MTVDTSYLTAQVNNIVSQLHGVFDDIGVPSHERDSREAEVGCRRVGGCFWKTWKLTEQCAAFQCFVGDIK